MPSSGHAPISPTNVSAASNTAPTVAPHPLLCQRECYAVAFLSSSAPPAMPYFLRIASVEFDETRVRKAWNRREVGVEFGLGGTPAVAGGAASGGAPTDLGTTAER